MAVGVVMIVAVVLIVVALVFYLVATILALRKITSGLDEVIAARGRDRREERAGQRRRRRRSTSNLDAGVDLLEGLLVKKAGMTDAVGLVDGLYPGRGRGRPAGTSPRAPTVTAPRIAEVYTQGTLTLARLGREAPIAAAQPERPALRNVEGGSLAARAALPRGPPVAAGGAAALAGDRHRRAGPVRAAGRHRRAAQAAAGRPPEPTDQERRLGADPGAIRVRARDERRGRDRVAAAARLRRRASSPAATACCR